MPGEAQRRAMLATMGIDVYVLRSAQATAPDVVDDMRIAVLCGKDDARHPNAAVLRKALPWALGCASGCIEWIEVSTVAGSMSLPKASVYLLLGAQVARAANEHMENAKSRDIIIAVADAPALSLADALARRALWQSLKPIARCLRGLDG